MIFNEKDLLRLASFPEQNPNPVIEITETGAITYYNPATLRYFPDILEKGCSHPIFTNVEQKLKKVGKRNLNNFSCETQVDGRFFEQKIYYIESTHVLRLYSSDITQQKQAEKKLAYLALFTEQNPNPVIELNLKNGAVTYSNPAATKRFLDLTDKGISHAIFNGIDASKKLDFSREVEVNGAWFEQIIYFIPESDLMRVYVHDISVQKAIQKKLLRLASFPEQTPGPIIEVNLRGRITYINPAGRRIFPDLEYEKFNHPVMLPLAERFQNMVDGLLSNYSCEIKINNNYYAQNIRVISESNVIRIFNNDITQQKIAEGIIREKNKDITDSINYARKIQASILPTEDMVHEKVTDYFTIYSPKDIISGDFYWFSAVDNNFLFACADCTGHGVPGALMSMIGSNFITHIVNEKSILKPGNILRELDKRLRKALRQDGASEGRDGMDIGFCKLKINEKVLYFSGANRPLVILRNGELIEYESCKYQVGGVHLTEKDFENKKIQLQSGDCIYLYSDGIVDQFGGPKGKKYMKYRFYAFLQTICHLPMPAQKAAIQKEFEDWKGDLEQTDDVCVFGVRVI